MLKAVEWSSVFEEGVLDRVHMDVLCTEHPQLKHVGATQLAEYVNFDELPTLQVRVRAETHQACLKNGKTMSHHSMTRHNHHAAFRSSRHESFCVVSLACLCAVYIGRRIVSRVSLRCHLTLVRLARDPEREGGGGKEEYCGSECNAIRSSCFSIPRDCIRVM
jgi:hypothetical protein